jgi:D-glycero-alpha-D-manno-heptose 1-phosphate guanylyltransferase
LRIDSSPLAVVLVGGLGKRIRHVLPDLPKPLAPVAGRPFLEWVLRFLHAQGIRRVVLSAGYMADKIDEFLRTLQIPELAVLCVHEPVPLGTAGALVYALKVLPDECGDVLICNGDSLALVRLDRLFAAFAEPATGVAIVGVQVPDSSRYGTLVTGQDGALVGFSEKRPGAGLVNAGVYLLRRSVLAGVTEGVPLSFEYDVFPSLLRLGVHVSVVPCDCPFLDIGSETTLSQADSFLLENMGWFG